MRTTFRICLPSLLLLFISFHPYQGIGQTNPVAAPNKYTISGFIKDAKTGEALIGGTVTVKELKGTGVSANSYGFYSLTIPEGNYTISVMFMGYITNFSTLSLKKNTKLDFALSELSKGLNEVPITAEKSDA